MVRSCTTTWRGFTSRYSALATLLLALITAPLMAAANATLSGKIVDAADGVTPVHPVWIWLWDPVKNQPVDGSGVNNNPDGTYRMAEVPEGPYKIFYDAYGTAAGYVDELYDNVSCEQCYFHESGDILNVSTGAYEVDVDMLRQPMLSGYVTNESGDPIPEVQIQIFNAAGEQVRSANLTTAEGFWSENVPGAGTYHVRTNPDTTLDYHPECWNNVICDVNDDPTQKGSPLEVTDQDMGGIDFRLEFLGDDVILPNLFSGSWYNPERNGEGFHFEMLDERRALIIWFTYPGVTDLPEARQSWILGVGEFDENDDAVFEEAFRASGPKFGPDFDTNDFMPETWGSIRIEFTGQDTARMHYDGLDGAGFTDVVKLTNLAQEGQSGSLPTGISGAWYDPDTNGQGWFVEILSASSALVYWFTYDENGNQAWNLGVGDILGNSIVIGEALAGTGTRFGTEFDKDNISLDPFAYMTLAFDGCDTGLVRYTVPDGEQFGAHRIDRLTRLQGFECTGVGSPSAGELTIMTNSSDPVITRFETENGTVMEDHGIRDSDGSVLQDSGTRIRFANGAEFYVNTREDGSEISVTDGSTQTEFSLKLLEEGILVSGNDPDSGATFSTIVPVDSASLLPGEGQQEQSPKRESFVIEQTPLPGLNNVDIPPGKTGAKVILRNCGQREDKGNVSFKIVSQVNDNFQVAESVPGTHVGEGNYFAQLLDDTAPEIQIEAAANAGCAPNPTWDKVCSAWDYVSWYSFWEQVAYESTPKTRGKFIDPWTLVCASAAKLSPNAALACVGGGLGLTFFCTLEKEKVGACQDEYGWQYRQMVNEVVGVRAQYQMPGWTLPDITGTLAYPDPGMVIDFGTQNREGLLQVREHSLYPVKPVIESTFDLQVSTQCKSVSDQTLRFRYADEDDAMEQCTVDAQGNCTIQLTGRAGLESDAIVVETPGSPPHMIDLKYVLPAPSLAGPGTGENLGERCHVDFEWSPVPSGLQYGLEINASNGAEWVYVVTDNDGFANSNYMKRVQFPDYEGQELHLTWRVATINRNGLGPYSEERTLIVTPNTQQPCDSAKLTVQVNDAQDSASGSVRVEDSLESVIWSCSDQCDQSYPVGTGFTLTAIEGANSVFTGWSGPCTVDSQDNKKCTGTLSEDATVVATFEPANQIFGTFVGPLAMNGTETPTGAGGCRSQWVYQADAVTEVSALGGLLKLSGIVTTFSSQEGCAIREQVSFDIPLTVTSGVISTTLDGWSVQGEPVPEGLKLTVSIDKYDVDEDFNVFRAQGTGTAILSRQ